MTEMLEHDAVQEEPDAMKDQARSEIAEEKPEGAPVSSEEVELPEGGDLTEVCVP